MSGHRPLCYCEEAVRFIEEIQDPVTRSLVNQALVQFVKRTSFELRTLCSS
jgi:hypothetical protein